MTVELETAVFTTLFILKDKQPILKVIRDENSEWQFLGNHECSPENWMVVSLKNILDYDISIHDVLDLAVNSEAFRLSKSHPWSR